MRRIRSRSERLNISPGLRIDRYNGISTGTGVQPRIGVSYQISATGTVLRGAYARTFETPYNENLIFRVPPGKAGLQTNVFGAFGGTPIQPGRRNQFNVGVEQAVRRSWLWTRLLLEVHR